MKDRCDLPGCKCKGTELVDKGYGYPVCRSQIGPLSPKNINPIYKGYEKMY